MFVFGSAEMFYSMGPAGMSSSVTSVRSGSEMSDSDMESSTHSQSSLAQPTVLTAQVCLLSVFKFHYICITYLEDRKDGNLENILYAFCNKFENVQIMCSIRLAYCVFTTNSHHIYMRTSTAISSVFELQNQSTVDLRVGFILFFFSRGW